MKRETEQRAKKSNRGRQRKEDRHSATWIGRKALWNANKSFEASVCMVRFWTQWVIQLTFVCTHTNQHLFHTVMRKLTLIWSCGDKQRQQAAILAPDSRVNPQTWGCIHTLLLNESQNNIVRKHWHSVDVAYIGQCWEVLSFHIVTFSSMSFLFLIFFFHLLYIVVHSSSVNKSLINYSSLSWTEIWK